MPLSSVSSSLPRRSVRSATLFYQLCLDLDRSIWPVVGPHYATAATVHIICCGIARAQHIGELMKQTAVGKGRRSGLCRSVLKHYFLYRLRKSQGVRLNAKKVRYYMSQAAIMGNHFARHDLGLSEKKDGNFGRAMKHFRIAALNGFKRSLEELREIVKKGMMTPSDQSSVSSMEREEKEHATALFALKRGCNMCTNSTNGAEKSYSFLPSCKKESMK